MSLRLFSFIVGTRATSLSQSQRICKHGHPLAKIGQWDLATVLALTSIIFIADRSVISYLCRIAGPNIDLAKEGPHT
jgi:hypothetical protein